MSIKGYNARMMAAAKKNKKIFSYVLYFFCI